MNRWPALAEFRSLGVLAVPIIITQLAQMGMGVADAIMAGRVSATELAGIALGGNLYWPLMLLMSGIVMAVTPSVSQLRGAGRIGDAGAVVRQALWIAVCGGATVALLLQHVEPAYRLFGVDERAIPVAAGYLRAASLGLPAMLAYVALRCLCEGMSWTRPAMFIGLRFDSVSGVRQGAMRCFGRPALRSGFRNVADSCDQLVAAGALDDPGLRLGETLGIVDPRQRAREPLRRARVELARRQPAQQVPLCGDALLDAALKTHGDRDSHNKHRQRGTATWGQPQRAAAGTAIEGSCGTAMRRRTAARRYGLRCARRRTLSS